MPPPTQLSARFLGLDYTAELHARGSPRFLRRQTPVHELLGGLVQVRSDLVADVLVQLSGAKQPAHAREECAHRPHDSPSWIWKKRATMPVDRCHSVSATRRCLRPA